MSPNERSPSSLLKDVEIVGSIVFKGELTFDGKFQGSQIEGNTLIIAENAKVNGSIQADFLTIIGTVTGNVTVTDKCHLKPTAHLEGDLKTSRLVMEDGATFIGSSEISPKPTNVLNMGVARKGLAG